MGSPIGSWEELTKSITGAIMAGSDVWQVIKEPPETVRLAADGRSPEWSLPIGRIAPRPRRSILDYAEVREVGMHYTSWQRAAPWRPGRAPPMPQDGARAGVEVIDVKISTRRSLLHDVTREMLSRDGGNVVRDVLASMRDEILLDVESEVRARLASTKREDGLGYDLHIQNTRQRGDYDRVPLGARHIIEAGKGAARACPHASFPHGLFCLLSPSQALQIMREGTLDTESMNVCGIDVVVSPLAGRRTDMEEHSAMVAVKGSVSVAMSAAKVKITQDAGVCGIEASYDMGAEIVPRMTARLVTERGAGDLVLHG